MVGSTTSCGPPSVNKAGLLLRPLLLLFPLLLSILAAILLYQDVSFSLVALPLDEITVPSVAAPVVHGKMMKIFDFVDVEGCFGSEDIAYDEKAKIIYIGCADGWIRKVKVGDLVTKKWVNTGGRPLGIVFGHDGEVIVADAELGLLNVSKDRKVQFLTDEAEGLKFKLTDATDVAADDTMYFTDATHKYSLRDCNFDLLEGRPNGRLLGYNPMTRETKVLVGDIYFANGVAVSPDQEFVIYCKTMICRFWVLEGDLRFGI